MNLEQISKETLSPARKGLGVTWDPSPGVPGVFYAIELFKMAHKQASVSSS